MEQQIYKIQQEEYANEIKKLPETTINLHIAGGFDKQTGFIYEPVGERKYLWKFKGYKGLSTARYMCDVQCSSCGNSFKGEGERKVIKCSCGNKIIEPKFKWKLDTDFNNLILEFDKEPLDKPIFKVPDKKVIDYWLNNDYRIDKKEVFESLKKYFMTYFDFPFNDKEASILAIGAIQSWLIEILDTVFYVSISGETGSGKTALGEALMLVSRHGFMVNSVSSSGIARCIEYFKLSMFFDEIDEKKHKDDEDRSSILRQGYRRNNFFFRLHPKTFIPETFNTFGFKAFSFRSDIVDDLQNRSLEVTLSKTKSQTLPIINMFKDSNSPFNLLFFWYFDNINEIYSQHPNFTEELTELELGTTKQVEIGELGTTNVNEVNVVNTVNIVNVNNNMYSSNTTNIDVRNMLIGKVRFLPNYINLVNQRPIFGRNIEISYLIYVICQILEVNIESLILEIVEQKHDTEVANEEEGWIGILKDILVSEYSNIFQREDCSFITYKKAIGKYVQRMREVYDIVPTQHQIKRMLRQIGFVDSLNKKVVKHDNKAVLALIYDSEIKKKLGITRE